MMKTGELIFLFLFLVLAGLLRFYHLGSIPPGLNLDEVSFGYNAYSLLRTGQDRFGETLPVMFRSLGTYLMPLYVYLSTLVVWLMGLNVASVRTIAALAGFLTIPITLWLLKQSKTDNHKTLIVIFTLAISPWAVLYSRMGAEASLSLTLFITAAAFFYKSLTNIRFLILGTIFIALAGSAYYTERYLGIIFYLSFVGLFCNYFRKYWKYLIFGVIIILIPMVVQITMAGLDANFRRIHQAGYFSFPSDFGFISYEFSSRYLSYFSPNNLFNRADPQQFRTIPDLSVFFSWMVVPFVFGLRFLCLNRKIPIHKLLILMMVITPVPAALTKEPFYTMRVLAFLWTLTVVIGLGLSDLMGLVKKRYLRVLIIGGIGVYSVLTLYTKLFVVFNYERDESFGFVYAALAKQLGENKSQKYVIDNSRHPGPGVWMPFFLNYPPENFQHQNSIPKGGYYANFDIDQVTKLDNINIRPIIWHQDIYQKQIIIGDNLAVSPQQAKEHKLNVVIEVKDYAGKIRLWGYQTDPKAKCNFEKQIEQTSPACLSLGN